MTELSVKPAPIPNKILPRKICQTLDALYIKYQPMKSGTFERIIVVLRPNESIWMKNEMEIVNFDTFNINPTWNYLTCE